MQQDTMTMAVAEAIVKRRRVSWLTLADGTPTNLWGSQSQRHSDRQRRMSEGGWREHKLQEQGG